MYCHLSIILYSVIGEEFTEAKSIYFHYTVFLTCMWFHCLPSSSFVLQCTRTSANPSLALAAPPSNVRITDPGLPSNTVGLRRSTTLTCSASGTNPRQYKWRHNGITIPAATSATYRVTSAQFSAAGQYTCEVSNWAGKDQGTYTLQVQGKEDCTLLAALNLLLSFLDLLLISCSLCISCMFVHHQLMHSH